MARPVLPTYEEAGREGFVKLFCFRENEFLDDELLLIVARLAKFEGKTRKEVVAEIEPHLDFKQVQNGPHKYQLWGSLDLLARIHKARHVQIDGVLE